MCVIDGLGIALSLFDWNAYISDQAQTNDNLQSLKKLESTKYFTSFFTTGWEIPFQASGDFNAVCPLYRKWYLGSMNLNFNCIRRS